MPPIPRIAEGFPDQRVVVLPPGVVSQARRKPITRELLPTDIGVFPRAGGHWRERSPGIDHAIFIYCANGAGWCELPTGTHAIAAGQLLIIPPGMSHRYGASKHQPWTIHWFHAAGHAVPEHLNLLGIHESNPILTLNDDAHWLALFVDVLETLEHGYRQANLIYASLTLAHLLGVTLQRRSSSPRARESHEMRLLRTIEYMKTHLDKPLRVPTLAGLANLSESHYTALFREQTGYAPVDYFIRLRIQHASRLLDVTSLSVKQVALRAGYADPLYFSRVFKTVMDLSPTRYRTIHKG